MKSLIETLADARRRQVAVGHFNISELTAFNGNFEFSFAMLGDTAVAHRLIASSPLLIVVSRYYSQTLALSTPLN
jgi:hypothetical protein